jgi:ABC-type Fe3+ transport system, permease component
MTSASTTDARQFPAPSGTAAAVARKPLFTVRRLSIGLALGVMGYFLIWPLVMLMIGSVRTSPLGDGAWTLDGYVRAFSDPQTYLRLLNSLLYAAVTTVVGLSIATFFAIMSTRVQTRLRRLITPIMVLLAVTPRLFFALSWGMLGAAESGLIGKGLGLLGASSVAEQINVFTWPGLLVVSCIKMVGYSYILLLGPISRMDRSLEDAAVLSGSSRLRALTGITIPMLAPAFLATGILVFVLGLQVFDIPAVIGMPAGIMTLSLHVNDYLVGGIRPDFVSATALSLVFVAVIVILLLVQKRILNRKSFATMTGKSATVSFAKAGRWAPLVDLSIFVFFLFAIALPLAQIVLGSFQGYFGVYGNWTVRHYAEVIADNDMVQTLLVTLGIAVFGGLVTVLAAFGMTYGIQRSRSRATRWLLSLGSWVPLMAPGIVLSVALLWAYLATPFVRELFGTPWLLLFALAVASIPIAIRALEGVVAQVSPTLEDAARMSGAGFLRAVKDVTARISAPSLLGAWLLVGLIMSGLLDVPLLLKTTGSQTVPTAAYSLYWDGNVAGAAALYCTYMLMVVLTILVGLAVTFAVLRLRKAGMRKALDKVMIAKDGADAHND